MPNQKIGIVMKNPVTLVYTLHCIQIVIIRQFLRNSTYILYIYHLIYERYGTTEKQTQGLLDVSSKNLIGKKHFRTLS